VIRGRAALQRQSGDNKGSDQDKTAKLTLVNHYDNEYRPQFEALFAGYSKSVLIVTGGINEAVKSFKEVQEAAAEAEKATMEVFTSVLGAASLGLDVLVLPDVTVKSVKEGLEQIKTCCDAAKEGAEFLPSPKPELPPKGSMPPDADPINFLTEKLSQVEGVSQWMNTMFAAASQDLDNPAVNWKVFDPEKYRQSYQAALDIANSVLKIPDPQPDSRALAHMYERSMWAAYLKPKEALRNAGSTLDFPVMERLTSLGIAAEAHVTFPESSFQSWYKQPEPKDNWGSQLLNWAQQTLS
jgi:hypothetical protein